MVNHLRNYSKYVNKNIKLNKKVWSLILDQMMELVLKTLKELKF